MLKNKSSIFFYKVLNPMFWIVQKVLDKKLITYLFLAIIFILAVFLRFYNLSSYPVGFHQDEANLGYNAYSLLLTGKDDSGARFPLYTSMFNEGNPTGYHYLAILPIKFFGLTEFATRFPGAFFASLTIIALFFLTKVLFKDTKVSLLAAFLIAIAPWHINFSRGSAETIVALFFIILGFALVIKSIESKSKKEAIVGTLILAISFFIYPMPRIFVPLMFLALLGLLFLFQRNMERRLWTIFISCFFFLVIIDGLLIFSVKGGTNRFNQVNIFNSFETNFQLQQEIIEDTKANSSYFISRLVHNKITNISYIFFNNYLEYFSWNFLFTKGGLPIWFQIPRMGLLYLIELPFLLYGVYQTSKSKNMYLKIPIIWLLVAPITAAITFDDNPNMRRSIVLFPVLELFAAYGFIHLLREKTKTIKYTIVSVSAVLLLFSFVYYLQQYFVNSKTHQPWYRNNGFSEMMSVVKDNYSEYDLIAMSKYQGGIYPLVLFYMQYDPKAYQLEGSSKNKDYGGFGKFFFMPQDCPSQTVNKALIGKRNLYIDKGDCPLDKSFKENKNFKYIYREDGSEAFRIVYD